MKNIYSAVCGLFQLGMNTIIFLYSLFRKLYLLHHPLPLSEGENTTIFFCSNSGKNTPSYAASFSQQKYYCFVSVSTYIKVRVDFIHSRMGVGVSVTVHCALKFG
jgi:hypothetical protein